MAIKYLLGILFGLLPCMKVDAQYEMSFPNAYYIPETWPSYTIKLSSKGTLVDLLDSGIQPYFLPGMNNKLEFKHCLLRVENPDRVILPTIAAESATIEAKPSGLYKLVLVGQAMTIAEARKMMIPWLPLIGRTEPELDGFLSAVDADPVSFDDPKFGAAPDGFSGGWSGSNLEMYTVWLDTSYRAEVPLRFHFTIRWLHARSPKDRRTPYRAGIPAPTGYEEFKVAEQRDYGPDSISEMMWAKKIPFLPGQGLGGAVSDVIEKSIDDAEPYVRKSTESLEQLLPRDSGRHYLWWVAGGILFLGVSGYFYVSSISRSKR